MVTLRPGAISVRPVRPGWQTLGAEKWFGHSGVCVTAAASRDAQRWWWLPLVLLPAAATVGVFLLILRLPPGPQFVAEAKECDRQVAILLTPTMRSICSGPRSSCATCAATSATGHGRSEMDEIPEGWLFDRRSWHFHRRLWERYQVRLEYGEFTAIRNAVNRGHAILLSRSERDYGSRKYAVKLRRGLWIKVLIDRKGVPVSALPWR